MPIRVIDDRAIRYRCNLHATLTMSNRNPNFGRVLDLSESGAFLETTADLQVGDEVALQIKLPSDEPWDCLAQVVRLGRGHRELQRPGVDYMTISRLGAAFQFVAPGEEDVERLRSFLDHLDEA